MLSFGSFEDLQEHNGKVYAWNNDVPTVRTEPTVCKNCNHEFAAPRRECSSCGQEVVAYNGQGNITQLSQEPQNEHFTASETSVSVYTLGGKAHLSSHCCCVIIALAIFSMRVRGAAKFNASDLWTILLILFAPCLYITYVIFSLLSGMQCKF